MKLSFLWDEDKTRRLFRTHLILFTIGAFVGFLYSLILVTDTPHRTILVAVPLIFLISIPFYLLTINRPNPGIRFLIFSLQSQLAASIFMAVSWGFLGIVQFAPYMFLVFTLFELGPTSAVILGIFSAITFVAIYIWTSMIQVQPNALADFLYYSISYVLIVVIARNLGNEISVQFEASRRIGQVDDLKNQFLAVTSHYLRTPISVIKGSVEEMSKQALSSDAKVDIENIKTSTAKLEALVEKFLKVSSIEKGQISITKWPGDLNNLLITIVNVLQPLAKAKSVTLIYQPAPPLNFPFDPVNLKEALVSVIDNAIKFNRPGGQVIISLTRDKDNAIIQIA